MIRSFAGQGLKDLYDGLNTDGFGDLSLNLRARVVRFLDFLNIMKDIESVKIPGIDNVERYAGGLAGNWRIRVDQDWFLVFRYFENDVYNLDLIRA